MVTVAKFIVFVVLIQHVGFLHNGVTDGDVRIGDRNIRDVLAVVPEVHGVFESVDQLVDFLVGKAFMDSPSIVLTAFLDKDVTLNELFRVGHLSIRGQIVQLIVINIMHHVAFTLIKMHVEVIQDLGSELMLEFGGVGLLQEMLPHDSKVLREVDGSIHNLHVLLNVSVGLLVGVVGIVFIMSEAVGISADLLVLVVMELVVALLVDKELVQSDRAVLVLVFEQILVVDLTLSAIEEFGLKRFVILDSPLVQLKLRPDGIEELSGGLFVVKTFLLSDQVQDFLH